MHRRIIVIDAPDTASLKNALFSLSMFLDEHIDKAIKAEGNVTLNDGCTEWLGDSYYSITIENKDEQSASKFFVTHKELIEKIDSHRIREQEWRTEHKKQCV